MTRKSFKNFAKMFRSAPDMETNFVIKGWLKKKKVIIVIMITTTMMIATMLMTA